MFAFISMIILYFSFFAIFVYKSIRQNNLINFSNILMATFGVIFIVCPLIFKNNNIINDEGFIFIIMMAMIALFISLLFLKTPRKIEKKYILLKKKNYLLKIVVYYYVFTTLYNIAYRFITSDFFNFITRDRGSERLTEEVYYAGISILGVLNYFIIPITLIYAFCLIKENKKFGYLIFFIYLINILLFSLHRTPVISVILLIFLYIHFYIKRFGILKITILVIIAFLILGYGAYMRSGIYDIKLPLFEVTKTGLRAFNTSESLYLIYNAVQNNRLDLEYGKNLYYYNIISFIPRRLWKEKPIVSFNARMTEEYYGYKIAADRKNWVHTFTVWGEGLMQFHFLGVILYSFLLVYIYRKYYQFLSQFEGSEIIIFQNILSIPIIMRGALDSILIHVIINIIVFYILKMFIYSNKTKKMDNSIISLITS